MRVLLTSARPRCVGWRASSPPCRTAVAGAPARPRAAVVGAWGWGRGRSLRGNGRGCVRLRGSQGRRHGGPGDQRCEPSER